MIKKAIKRYSIDINNSLVGDKLSDIEAGMSAGIDNLFLIEMIMNQQKPDQHFANLKIYIV